MPGSSARWPSLPSAWRGREAVRGRFVIPLAAATLAASIACSPPLEARRADDPRPDILVISLDTTRADHLSAYGYERETSPRLSQLAAEGIRFDAAYAPSATTGPTHASLFTGFAPMAHDVRKNGQTLASPLVTLAERLRAAGFETAGVVSSFVLSARFGFDQGFDVWDEDFSNATAPEGLTIWEGLEIEGKFYGSAEDTTRRALRWLDAREHPERPFFLVVHYFDPHDPYTPPPGYHPPFDAGPRAALKQVRTVFFYDLLLAFTDEQVGLLLDGLADRDLDDDTLVVVVGDHGEGLMDHGHPFHGAQIYEEAVRVPFIARWPGRIAPGQVVTAPTAIVELQATLAAIGDAAAAAPVERAALAGRLGVTAGAPPAGDAAAGGDAPVFLYRRHYEPADLGDGITVAGEQYGVRAGRWKLIQAPEEQTVELYDLERDAAERENRASAEPERVAALQALIDAWRSDADAKRRAWRGASGEPDERRELDPEERARLEALGYVE